MFKLVEYELVHLHKCLVALFAAALLNVVADFRR